MLLLHGSSHTYPTDGISQGTSHSAGAKKDPGHPEHSSEKSESSRKKEMLELQIQLSMRARKWPPPRRRRTLRTPTKSSLSFYPRSLPPKAWWMTSITITMTSPGGRIVSKPFWSTPCLQEEGAWVEGSRGLHRSPQGPSTPWWWTLHGDHTENLQIPAVTLFLFLWPH